MRAIEMTACKTMMHQEQQASASSSQPSLRYFSVQHERTARSTNNLDIFALVAGFCLVTAVHAHLINSQCILYMCVLYGYIVSEWRSTVF